MTHAPSRQQLLQLGWAPKISTKVYLGDCHVNARCKMQDARERFTEITNSKIVSSSAPFGGIPQYPTIIGIISMSMSMSIIISTSIFDRRSHMCTIF